MCLRKRLLILASKKKKVMCLPFVGISLGLHQVASGANAPRPLPLRLHQFPVEEQS